MILFLGFALIVVGAYFLAKMVALDSGYILISYAGHAFELSFWWGLFLAVVTFIAMYLLFRLISMLLSTTSFFGRINRRRQRKSSQSNLAKGLSAYFEGDWKAANKALLKGAKNSAVPEINYLAAAHASQMQGDFDEAESLLDKAKESQEGSKKQSIALDLSRAELYLEKGAYQSCAEICQEILVKKPKNEGANRLLVDAYLEQDDLTSLAEFLPKLTKQKIFSEEEINFFKGLINRNQMTLAQEAGEKGLTAFWKDLSTEEKKNEDTLEEYVEMLIDAEAMVAAEKTIADSLKVQWNSDLAAMYADVRLPDCSKQVKQLEVWLKQQPTDANLLLAAGRLSMRSKDMEKAKDYLRKSLEQKEQSKAYAVLGKLLEVQGEKDGSLDCYRKGLLLKTA